jgi:hypothetical protein
VQIDSVNIAAFGTLISVATLVLTLYFRRRDSQTHMKIDYQVGALDNAWLIEAGGVTPEKPVAAFRVQNAGKHTVLLYLMCT